MRLEDKYALISENYNKFMRVKRVATNPNVVTLINQELDSLESELIRVGELLEFCDSLEDAYEKI
jgi:hypothetical protein